ncbi:MAG: SMP-30/gluconolaconase/LRE-like region [Leptospirales bacterium]|nr:SMP-30/gluconolaconase/LRE-like region [Leptospirales bacterium]
MKRVLAVLAAALLSLCGYLYYPRAERAHLVMAESYDIGPTPSGIEAVRAAADDIASHLRHRGDKVPGFDDLILYEDRGFGIATGMDGYFWKIDLASGAAERFAKTPLIAAGAVRDPGDPDRIYACVSRLHGEPEAPDAKVGLYELRLSTRTVQPVLTRTLIPPAYESAPGASGKVYRPEEAPALAVADFNDSNSAPMAFCNDLAVSADGQRIYMTTPYAYAGAAMGGGAFGEAITLARNGLLWQFDRRAGTLALAARDFNFIDGILIEGQGNEKEQSLLITETTKFRIDRLFLNGPRAGAHDTLWEYLPGMPDGMDRDAEGRIWIGIIKKRTGLITFAHRNLWLKYALLNVPQSLLPIPHQTGVLALSPDASQALYYAEYEGEGPQEISVAVPGRSEIYLPNFRKSSRGLYSIPYPAQLQASSRATQNNSGAAR